MIAWMLWMACRPSDTAPEAFDNPLIGAYRTFAEDDDVFAEQLRQLEAQIYGTMEVASSDLTKRSLLPGLLVDEDVADLEPRPDRDLSGCLAVALAYGSPHDLAAHATLPLVADQRPLEPASPDHFDREFLEGQDCWGDRSCTWLRTYQDLTKVYTLGIVPPITYAFYKDFRWVDLAAGLEDEAPRWAFVAKSWNDDSYSSENEKNWLYQSYTLEIWLPRDGRGFTFEGAGTEPVSDDATDSSAGGTLRFLSLWTENEIAASDNDSTEIGTIRWGMDRNMAAHDDYLDDE